MRIILLGVTVLVFILIFGFVFYKNSKFKIKMSALPTFKEYKANNPELVNNGNVICIECGGAHVYIRISSVQQGKILNTHVCKTCGTNLYRSLS